MLVEAFQRCNFLSKNVLKGYLRPESFLTIIHFDYRVFIHDSSDTQIYDIKKGLHDADEWADQNNQNHKYLIVVQFHADTLPVHE